MFFKNFGSETKERFYNNKNLTVRELFIRNFLSLLMKACNNLHKKQNLEQQD